MSGKDLFHRHLLPGKFRQEHFFQFIQRPREPNSTLYFLLAGLYSNVGTPCSCFELSFAITSFMMS